MLCRTFATLGPKLLQATVVVALAACASTEGDNSDRADDFTDILSGADLSAPSDLGGLQGTATFDGVAVATFGYDDVNKRPWGGTGDAQITVNFSDGTLSGRMTDWSDLDPNNYELNGEVALSNGVITDGAFTSQVAGNIERTVRGPDLEVDPAPLLGERLRPAQAQVKVFSGAAVGTIYDSVSGAPATHIAGGFSTISDDPIFEDYIQAEGSPPPGIYQVDGTDNSPVTGSFAASR